MNDQTALLIVDMQLAGMNQGIGDRCNEDAEKNAGALLKFWRDNDWPVVHVRHDSRDPDSAYHPDKSGHAFHPDVMPVDGEPIVAKDENSAFVSTDLHEILQSAGITDLVIVGVLMEYCVGFTARHAFSLGYTVTVISDATASVDAVDANGKVHKAKDVLALNLANFAFDYGDVKPMADILP